MANQPALIAGTAQIGSVTVSNVVNSIATLVTGTNFIGLATAVVGNSDAQAVPVYISGRTQTDKILNYTTTAAVAAAGTTNHDYVVTGGKTLLVRKVITSGSGKLKAAFLGGTTIAIGVIFNSTANPMAEFELPIPYEQAASTTFRVTLTNRDSAAQDLYSTLIGEEV